jgi:hypothetical protein
MRATLDTVKVTGISEPFCTRSQIGAYLTATGDKIAVVHPTPIWPSKKGEVLRSSARASERRGAFVMIANPLATLWHGKRCPAGAETKAASPTVELLATSVKGSAR